MFGSTPVNVNAAKCGAIQRYSIFAAVALSISTVTPAIAQEAPNRHLAARTELHAIPTLTLSDEQFLKADAAGAKQAIVTAQLRIAQGSGRLPVVILIHGSGGVGPNIDAWIREINEMGVSTWLLDGFSGRGLTSVAADQALLGRTNLILDNYRSLEVLAKHPRVDPSRIAVMGFSRGGQAALFSSMKRFQTHWNKSGVQFAAYIPFYPDCMTSFIDDADTIGGPIRIFHGASDDFNPIAPCKAYVERLRGAGRDAQLAEYPNAQHVFDNPLGSLKPTIVKGGQSVRGCAIREQPLGQLINAVTGQPFTYKDACVELNPHIAHDPAALQAARQAVKGLLQAVFGLN